MRSRIISFILIFTLFCSNCFAQFNINFLPDATVTNPLALSVFERAASQWESRITDNITVTIQMSYVSNLPVNTYANANPIILYNTHNEMRDILISDALDEGSDDSIVSALPTQSQMTAILPATFSLHPYLWATKANMKALNVNDIDSFYGLSDGIISINSNLNYDYNNLNGVGISTLDLESIVAHEIGHILGFISVVDSVEYYKGTPFNPPVSPMLMDLFRFSSANTPSNILEFTSFPRFLDSGGSAVFADLNDEYPLSTGVRTGNGWSASHWSPVVPSVGIMKPALAYETIANTSNADFRVLDLIGYDINSGTSNTASPEPSSILLILFVGGLLIAKFKKKPAI